MRVTGVVDYGQKLQNLLNLQHLEVESIDQPSFIPEMDKISSQFRLKRIFVFFHFFFSLLLIVFVAMPRVTRLILP